MPYTIRKLPNKNKYRVYDSKGKILSNGSTLKNAKSQVRLLNAIDNNPKFKKKLNKKK